MKTFIVPNSSTRYTISLQTNEMIQQKLKYLHLIVVATTRNLEYPILNLLPLEQILPIKHKHYYNTLMQIKQHAIYPKHSRKIVAILSTISGCK